MLLRLFLPQLPIKYQGDKRKMSAEPDNDDGIVGRVLTRREVLALFGLASSQLLVACSPRFGGPPPGGAPNRGGNYDSAAKLTGGVTQTAAGITMPTCVVAPAVTEGPYFVDEKLNRSDIRVDTSDNSSKPGTPFKLTMRVLQAGSGSCVPLKGAVVDIWHCDALGVYSDAVDAGFNTKGKNFLRGYQVSDANGLVTFQTIYPGWYQGRAVHIHFKVRTSFADGKSSEFTSQFFFDDAFSDKVYTVSPYNAKTAVRGTKNANDGIFKEAGSSMILNVMPDGAGYTANFDIGMKL